MQVHSQVERRKLGRQGGPEHKSPCPRGARVRLLPGMGMCSLTQKLSEPLHSGTFI